MKRYVVGRIAQAVVVLWGAYTVAYLILYLLPGDELALMLTASGIDMDTLSATEIAKARRHYGLDQGPVERYFTLLWNALHGDFGLSLNKGVPVSTLLAERLPHTLALASLAVTLSIIRGIGFAYAVGALRWQWIRHLLERLPALGFSVPVFWVGLLLIQVFAFDLNWFPSTGNDGLASLVLPAFALSIPSGAVYAQVLLRGFSDVSREPYIGTARSKGLTRGQVQWRHAFRNAALPLLTLVGLQVGNTVSGTVLIETVFGRIGVGRLAEEAVLHQDVPVVLAVVSVSAAAFVTVNLVVDLLYPVIDPRVARARGI
ncbi:MAG: ABC transporter permease [Polyangiaceae bacterium]|jgi:peptide/nickel transport system permease protein